MFLIIHQMKKCVFIFFVLVFGFFESKANEVYLDNVLKTSKFKGEIFIKEYILNADSTIRSIQVALYSKPDSIFSVTKMVPDQFWSFPRKYFKKQKSDVGSTNSYWPDVNERILMILDSSSALIFFGEILSNNKYRIFTNLFTGSSTGIYSKYKFESMSPKRVHSDQYLYLNFLYITREDLKTKWI